MKQYYLRCLKAQDAFRMLEWMHDESMTRYLFLDGHNSTIDDALNFIQAAQSDRPSLHRAIIDDNDCYLGTVSLKDIDDNSGRAEYAIALHPTATGTGAALEASKKILKIGFFELKLKQIYLNVLRQNTRAIRFYEKLSTLGLHQTEGAVLKAENCSKELLWYSIEAKEFLENLTQKNKLACQVDYYLHATESLK